MTELVELGEEIGCKLEGVEVEEQVPSVAAIAVGGIVAAVIGGCAGGPQAPLQAGAQHGQEPHPRTTSVFGLRRKRRANIRRWLFGKVCRVNTVQLYSVRIAVLDGVSVTIVCCARGLF